MNPDVVVCAKNSLPTLEPCVSSIRREFPSSRIVVVDDSFNDDTLKLARGLGCSAYRGPGRGVGAARDYSLDLVETPTFVFVDSDAVLDEGFSGLLGELGEGDALVNAFVLFGKPNYPLLWEISEAIRGRRRGNPSFAGAALDTGIARKLRIRSIQAGEDRDFIHRLRERGYATRTSFKHTVTHPMTYPEAMRAQEWYGEAASEENWLMGLYRCLRVLIRGVGLTVIQMKPRIMGYHVALAYHWFHGYTAAKVMP